LVLTGKDDYLHLKEGILWWFKYNMYIQSVYTTAVLLSLHVSVPIGPSSGDVHISKLKNYTCNAYITCL
jgi:hypothetical protein